MINHVKQFFLKGEVIMQTNYENLLRESPESLTLEGLNEWIIQLRNGRCSDRSIGSTACDLCNNIYFGRIEYDKFPIRHMIFIIALAKKYGNKVVVGGSSISEGRMAEIYPKAVMQYVKRLFQLMYGFTTPDLIMGHFTDLFPPRAGDRTVFDLEFERFEREYEREVSVRAVLDPAFQRFELKVKSLTDDLKRVILQTYQEIKRLSYKYVSELETESELCFSSLLSRIVSIAKQCLQSRNADRFSQLQSQILRTATLFTEGLNLSEQQKEFVKGQVEILSLRLQSILASGAKSKSNIREAVELFAADLSDRSEYVELSLSLHLKIEEQNAYAFKTLRDSISDLTAICEEILCASKDMHKCVEVFDKTRFSDRNILQVILTENEMSRYSAIGDQKINIPLSLQKQVAAFREECKFIPTIESQVRQLNLPKRFAAFRRIPISEQAEIAQSCMSDHQLNVLELLGKFEQYQRQQTESRNQRSQQVYVPQPFSASDESQSQRSAESLRARARVEDFRARARAVLGGPRFEEFERVIVSRLEQDLT